MISIVVQFCGNFLKFDFQWKFVCVILLICASKGVQSKRPCPIGSIDGSEELCSCNNPLELFDKEKWICVLPKKEPYINKVKSSLKTSNVALTQCPKKSNRNENGTCTCDRGYYMYEKPDWVCCPENSIADNNGYCYCTGIKSYFDHFYFICFTKPYLITPNIITTTREPTPPPPPPPLTPCENYPNRFKPYCPCPNNVTRIYPYCYDLPPTVYCEPPLVGTYPYCYLPCPQYHYRKCIIACIFLNLFQ